jgi:hypothetical protein
MPSRAATGARYPVRQALAGYRELGVPTEWRVFDGVPGVCGAQSEQSFEEYDVFATSTVRSCDGEARIDRLPSPPQVAAHLETARADILAFTDFVRIFPAGPASSDSSAPSSPRSTTTGPKAAATSAWTSSPARRQPPRRPRR